MVDTGKLSRAQRAKYRTFPEPNAPARPEGLGGQTGYLVDTARMYVAGHSGISDAEFDLGGYQIYTTFERPKVDALAAAVKQHLDGLRPKERAADRDVRVGAASCRHRRTHPGPVRRQRLHQAGLRRRGHLGRTGRHHLRAPSCTRRRCAMASSSNATHPAPRSHPIRSTTATTRFPSALLKARTGTGTGRSSRGSTTAIGPGARSRCGRRSRAPSTPRSCSSAWTSAWTGCAAPPSTRGCCPAASTCRRYPGSHWAPPPRARSGWPSAYGTFAAGGTAHRAVLGAAHHP